MKGGRSGVEVVVCLGLSAMGMMGGCAYGGDVDPAAREAFLARAAGGAGGASTGKGGSESSTVPGSSGAMNMVSVGPGAGGGVGETGEDSGATDAAEEPASVVPDPPEPSVVEAGPRDSGARDVVVVDVVKPPLLFDSAKLYFIRPKNGSPGIAMDVDLNSQSNGARVKQWTFSAGDNAEQFYISDNGNGTWRIAMKDNRNQCVDNPANQVVDSTKLQMWQCMNNDIWQQWIITPDTSGTDTFQLKNVGSNLYLDQPGSMTNIDLTLQVYTQNGTNAQKWIITATM